MEENPRTYEDIVTISILQTIHDCFQNKTQKITEGGIYILSFLSSNET